MSNSNCERWWRISAFREREREEAADMLEATEESLCPAVGNLECFLNRWFQQVLEWILNG